jgi:hypothetical protein
VYVHNGIPSYWSNPRDLDANDETPLTYLFHCILGHHGLLSLTPVLLLTLIGWIFIGLGAPRHRRWVIHAGAVLTLATLGFYLTRTQNYNYGGNSVALRWMLWLSPFWWIAMVPALESPIRRYRRIPIFLTMVTLLPSVISVSWSLDHPWRPSWLYEMMAASGKINYRTQTEPFTHPRGTVLGDLPLQPGTTATWISTSGERFTLTVDEGEDSQTETDVIPVTMILTNAKATAEWKLRIDRERFLAGEGLKAIQASLVGDSGTPRINPVTLLQGLPVSRTFNPVGTIWVPSLSDPSKAWKADRASARVLMQDPVFGRSWHRCDVQYCDQLPFGVLQWKTAVSSEATGEVLSTTTWIAEKH